MLKDELDLSWNGYFMTQKRQIYIKKALIQTASYENKFVGKGQCRGNGRTMFLDY